MMHRMALTDEPATATTYGRIEALLHEQRCVILDGGIATELGRRRPDATPREDEALWGTWALVHQPDAVRDVHRAYLDVGCDVISTNTWGLTGELDRRAGAAFSTPVHWMSGPDHCGTTRSSFRVRSTIPSDRASSPRSRTAGSGPVAIRSGRTRKHSHHSRWPTSSGSTSDTSIG